MEQSRTFKQVLSNGLTVLVVPRQDIPKVSIQLWYNVGSKDEKSKEKGIAHLIEHMIFKGTSILSECDITQITHKLSGYCNAYTSHDYTGYLFDFPSQHWQVAFSIMADCMRNCTFKEEFLNSELQAVIQELKMYKDDYVLSLIEYMLSVIFPDHPYHYPIIGYKQDLWSLKREDLIAFYDYYYVPNNAVLVVVGDIAQEQVFELAHKEFGNIPVNEHYKKEQFYHSPDLRNNNITVYREVKQPVVLLAWTIPGAKLGNDYLLDIIHWVIGSGKGSRLYKKLVEGLELVTELDVFNYDLFDYGVFFIYFQPKKTQDIDYIIKIIHQELAILAQQEPTEREITRGIKKTEVEYLALLESNQKQAFAIGKYYLATKNENFLYSYLDYPKESLAVSIKNFVASYLQPTLMNQGKILPIAEENKKYWLQLQEISDAEDARILKGRARQETYEEGRCVHDIEVKKPKAFDYPKAQTFKLNNGLKVIACRQNKLPKIDIILDLKVKYYYDPENLEGISYFVGLMLAEGTKNYTAQQLADILEYHGMALSVVSGQIALSMLSIDLGKGLELLNEMLTNALFEPQAIERIRDQIIAELNDFWDTPYQFVSQLVRDTIYKNHPYHKNCLGTEQSIKRITQADLLDFYKQFYTPVDARLAIVGDIVLEELEHVLDSNLNTWQGKDIFDIEWPMLNPISYQEINYPIMRDQTVLCYAGLSINRKNKDFDKLLLFDQIFGGGILNSMNSRLFDLRERSGLFYTITGTLTAKAGHQSGIIIVKTIVSNDRLQDAETAIEKVIDTAVNTLTQSELQDAKNILANSIVDNFASNYKIAATLLFKDEYNLPENYFDIRSEQLANITVAQIQESVKKYLSTKKMIKIRIGRIEPELTQL